MGKDVAVRANMRFHLLHGDCHLDIEMTFLLLGWMLWRKENHAEMKRKCQNVLDALAPVSRRMKG